MQSLYLTLLSATLTLFGIFSAIIFFYINQLASEYSIRTSSFLLRKIWTILFIIIGIIAALFSSLGAFSLSTTHNLIPRYDFYIRSWVTEPWYALCVLLCVLTLCGLFVYILYKYPKYLKANIVIPDAFKKIKAEDVKVYIFRYFFNPPEPTQWDFLTPGKMLSQPIEKWSAEEKRKYEEEMRYFTLALQEYNELKKNIDNLVKKGTIIDSYFSIVFDISKKALLKHDLTSWKLFHTYLVSLIKNWIDNEVFGICKFRKTVRRKTWDPYLYFSKLLVENLSHMKETVNASGQPSLHYDIVMTSKHVAYSFASTGSKWNAVQEIISFMKDTGKELIDRGKIDNIHTIFESFGELGEESIKQKEKYIFDEICRSFGDLGEQLISKGISPKPLMPDLSFTDEKDSLIKCIEKIKDTLVKEKLSTFSQVYYAAIEAITLKFIEKGKEGQTFEEVLLRIVSCIAECGEEAAKLSDGAIISYSVKCLRKIFDETRKFKRYTVLPKDILIWIARIGVVVYNHNKDLVEIVIQKLLGIDDEELIAFVMNEIFYGTHCPYEGIEFEGIWELITRMGKAYHSNFGFNFDWNTGETYAPDDSLRERIDSF